MKKHGAHCSFIAARNRELAEKARRLAVERGTFPSNVMDEVAESEASRFWIDEERALQLVRERRRGVVQKRKTREAMAREIQHRAEAIMKSDPEKRLPEAVFEAVNSPAPSYYISGRSVKRAIAARKRGYIPSYRLKGEKTDSETKEKEEA